MSFLVSLGNVLPYNAPIHIIKKRSFWKEFVALGRLSYLCKLFPAYDVPNFFPKRTWCVGSILLQIMKIDSSQERVWSLKDTGQWRWK
jgi:ribosomal protein S26